MEYKPIGSKILRLDIIDSTNFYLQNQCKVAINQEGTLVWAENQTNGRGQAGNSWFAKENDSLTFSFVLYPNYLIPEEQFYLSKAFSIAVCKFLFYTFNLSAQIKWPNDILLNNQKICGILIENSIIGSKLKQSIVGIGININNAIFPKEIKATSVFLNTQKRTDLYVCIEAILPYLNDIYALVQLKNWKQLDYLYHSLLYGLDELHPFFDSKHFEGKIKKVDAQGYLHMESPEGIKKFAFKEVVYC